MELDAEEDRASEVDIRRLTKCRRDTGETYRRRSEIEAQIEESLAWDAATLRQRVAVSTETDSQFLKSETLVYLLREGRRAGDESIVEEVMRQLERRIFRLLVKWRGKFPNLADFEDFRQDAHLALLEKIFDVDSDCADYAEVSFGDYVATMGQTKALNFIRKQGQSDARCESFDASSIDEEGNERRFEIRADAPSTEQMLTDKEAIASLPAHIRDVAVLHYLVGWQIESKDAREPTLSRRFGREPRTIRNWLKQAERELAAWRGGRR